MGLKNRGRVLAAGVLAAGVVVGAGVVTVTPAGAVVKDAASTINWKTIWKTEIKPRADKRYYTKKNANKTFVKSSALATILSPYVTTTALNTALGNYYTKAQSDANYYTKAQADTNYYTKAQADAKYAPAPKLMRGSFFAGGASPSGSILISGGSISFGVTFSAAPTTHYIPLGSPVPAGCLGNANAPDALPGNLCLFETFVENMTANRGTLNNLGGVGSNAFGAGVFGYSAATGQAAMLGTWAARPVSILTTSIAPQDATTTSGKGGLNR